VAALELLLIWHSLMQASMDLPLSSNTPILRTTLEIVMIALSILLPDKRTPKFSLMVMLDSQRITKLLYSLPSLRLVQLLSQSMLLLSTSMRKVFSMVLIIRATSTLTTLLPLLVMVLLKAKISGLSETLGAPVGVKMVTSESGENNNPNAVSTTLLYTVTHALDKYNNKLYVAKLVFCLIAHIPWMCRLLADQGGKKNQ